MSAIIDETGNQYGRLTVLYRAPDHITSSGNKKVMWHCKCECGNEKDIDAQSLRNNLTKSCGCLQKEKASQIKFINLTGQRSGKLIAIEPTKERKHGNIVWKCQCDCGNIHYVTSNNFSMKKVQSCGQCINSHNSKGEEKIKQLLIDNNYNFETEKIFDDCYFNTKGRCRFDFYINNQYLIEYDGRQHYIKDKNGFGSDLDNIQKRDKYKNQWCKEHNIPLIRIPYTAYEELTIEDLQLETSKFLIKGE